MKEPIEMPVTTGSHNLLLKHNTHLPDIAQLLREPGRSQRLQHQCLGLHLDARRCSLPGAALATLHRLAEEKRLPDAIHALFSGVAVNQSEQRPALHMALRAASPQQFLPQADADAVLQARHRMLQWAASLHRGELPETRAPSPEPNSVRDLIHIGIGGSDLGARLLANALPDSDCRPRLHFISAPDPYLWQRIIERADRQHSAVIITTKSFSTVETLTLASAARDWLGPEASQRMFAVTAALDKAAEWLPREHILPMWEWTGGRFSLWSCAGIMGAVAIGVAAYTQLLAGAAAMDEHFQHSPASENLPLHMALYDYWLHSVQDYPVRGIYMYDQRLQLVPHWLRQLEMESLGKSVQQNGQAVTGATAAMLVGGSGPDAQHAIFQALHQGTRPWPTELVLVRAKDSPHPELQRLQWASMLAQAQALTHGVHHPEAPARELPGNRPVLQWVLDDLQPQTLGAWLAAYEHKVYSLACLWGINAFDQWGVEEGKRLARLLMTDAREHSEALDPVTQDWLHRLEW